MWGPHRTSAVDLTYTGGTDHRPGHSGAPVAPCVAPVCRVRSPPTPRRRSSNGHTATPETRTGGFPALVRGYLNVMATVLNTFMSSGRRDDSWNTHHRSEAPLKRADRNFAELLQELRVLFTGVQILLGFLLTLAFSPVFPGLDGFRHAVYVVTLLAAASSSGLLIAPVALHRLLFQGGHKQAMVRAGHAAALLALSGLGLTLSSGLLLVLDIAVGRGAAVSVTAVFILGFGLLWWAFPYWLRRQTMD